MRSLLCRNKPLLIAVAVLTAWFAGFQLWAARMTAAPVDSPIALAPRGTLETEIRVHNPESYHLELRFRVNAISRDEAWRLVGAGSHDQNGQRIPSGVVVPIRWTLISLMSGAIAASGEAETFGSSGHSADEFSRPASSAFTVPPGRYRLRAEIMRDVPELSRLPVRLWMTTSPKASSTWQSNFAFFGGVASWVLIAPLATGLVLLLGVLELLRAFRAPRRRSTEPQR